MSDTRIAKLFRNGASQAVRLPADFRFTGNEVYATRDPETGDVVLSQRPGARNWDKFFALRRNAAAPADFMDERPMNAPPRDRAIFHDAE
jgi:antitoxin VapB